jgi:hypothetical protein
MKPPDFYINPVDMNGRAIDKWLIDLAEGMWSEAAYWTAEFLDDVSRTSEMVEAVVHRAWDLYLAGTLQNAEHFLRNSIPLFVRCTARKEHREEDTDPAKLDKLREALPEYVSQGIRYQLVSQDTGDLERRLEAQEYWEYLTDREKTLVELRVILEHDWKYISNRTGIPVGTAKTQCSNALRKLRKIAEGTHGDDKKK